MLRSCREGMSWDFRGGRATGDFSPTSLLFGCLVLNRSCARIGSMKDDQQTSSSSSSWSILGLRAREWREWASEGWGLWNGSSNPLSSSSSWLRRLSVEWLRFPKFMSTATQWIPFWVSQLSDSPALAFSCCRMVQVFLESASRALHLLISLRCLSLRRRLRHLRSSAIARPSHRLVGATQPPRTVRSARLRL